jgi:pSer/pThr/pTyr-binding forkhead associated (FHA) protein
VPHLWNLNEDPALQGVVAYFVREGTTRIGNGKGDAEPDICLRGVNILPDHAALTNENGQIFVKKASNSVKILVNGEEIG